MIVSMWMTREVVTVAPNVSLHQAAQQMTARRVRRLPVVSADQTRLLGIVSASDLRRVSPAINPFGLTDDTEPLALSVADVMTRDPIITTPEAPIEEAARTMRDRKIGSLPVVRDEVLAGVITESDIFRAFVSIFDASSAGVRVTFDVPKDEDTMAVVSRFAHLHHVRVHSLIAARQHDRPVCVVRFSGRETDAVVEDLWDSGHHVLNVLRFGGP